MLISLLSLYQLTVRGWEPDTRASIFTVFPSESIRDSGGLRVKLGAILCSVNEERRSGTVLDENNKTLETWAEVRSHQKNTRDQPVRLLSWTQTVFLFKSNKQNPKSPEPKSSDRDLFQDTTKFCFVSNKHRGTIPPMKGL